MKKSIILGAALACCATPAAAQMPESVRAMIDAAIAKGDPAKVQTVVEIARETNPEDLAEIDAVYAVYTDSLAREAKAQETAKLAEIRDAGLFSRWNGNGELGGFRSTGNSTNTGLTAGLQLTRTGIDWTHKLRARADYQRTNGFTSREQYFASYEPNIEINDRLYGYGLAQFEHDRFQGFDGRYSVSGGLGYKFIESEDLNLSAKAGPAYRYTDLSAGGSESRLAALVGVDFGWSITDRLKLTQQTSAVADGGGQATLFIDGQSTSINAITGLEAKVSDKLSMRASYQVDYDSEPPAGAVTTDTQTRVSLVYGF